MTNLVLIDCHDLGRHLGAYGWDTVPSPNLDTLAATGVRFANSFCTAPQCSPSRAALYTGRYPHATGMLGLAHSPFDWRLHKNEVHLARYLQNAGYLTAHIGVQHVTGSADRAVHDLGFAHVERCHAAPDVATRATTFLSNASARPFFLKIGFAEPHRDANGVFNHAPLDRNRGVTVPPYLPQTAEARQEFGELQGVIQRMDNAVGQILATLNDLELLENTWLIFTTDHGLAMPRAKCTLYDAGIETALIMLARPFGLSGGRVYRELISNVDIVPTILEMFDLPLSDAFQGRSVAALLRGNDFQPRKHIFAEKTFHTAYEPQRAVRTTSHKLIWNTEAGIMNVPGDTMHSPIFPQMIDEITVERPPFELYDLEVDPLERTNLFDLPAYADVSEELRSHLLAWMQETDDPILHGPIASPFYFNAMRQLTGQPL